MSEKDGGAEKIRENRHYLDGKGRKWYIVSLHSDGTATAFRDHNAMPFFVDIEKIGLDASTESEGYGWVDRKDTP